MSGLYPRSGVGVVAPWLVVAPPDNPVIRIDLRGLDRVVRRDDGDRPPQLSLVCADLETSVHIADGADAVDAIVREAWPLTREGVAASPPVVDVERFLFIDDDAVLLRRGFVQIGNRAFRLEEVREYALHGANIPVGDGLLQAALAMLVVAAAEREAASVFRIEDFWTATSGSGDAPPIVWLHGGPGLWDYLAPAASLMDACCVSYRYDQRGCGRTYARGGWTVAQSVSDLEALRAHWGAEQIVLAGHGWGASLALHYGLAHPERVAGRILIGTCGQVRGSSEAAREELVRRLGPERTRLEELLERLNADATLEDERAYFELLWAPDCIDPASVRTLFVEDLRVDLASRLDDADRQHVEQPDFLERLGRQSIPTLVVHGEHDTRPVSAARELAARMPGAELLVVPGAGHYPWIEALEVFRAALHDFRIHVRRDRMR